MKKSVRGFTLVELIIVVAVISLLSVSAMVFYRTNSDQADNSVRQNDIQTVEAALGSQSKVQSKSFADTSKVYSLDATQRAAIQDKNLNPPSSTLNLYPIDPALAEYLSLTTDELKNYAVDDYNRVYYIGPGHTAGDNDEDRTAPELKDDMIVTEPPKVTPRPEAETPPPTPEPTRPPAKNDSGDGEEPPVRPDPPVVPVETFDWQKYVEARLFKPGEDGKPDLDKPAASAGEATRNGKTTTSTENGGNGTVKAAHADGDDYFYDIHTMYGGARGICFEYNNKYYIIKQKTSIGFSTLKGLYAQDGYDLSKYYHLIGMIEVDLHTCRVLEYVLYSSGNYAAREGYFIYVENTNKKINPVYLPIVEGDVLLYNGNYYVWIGGSITSNTAGFTFPSADNSWLWINTSYTPKIY